MKVFCKQCGCHFPEDFKETQEPECKWWQLRGFPEGFSRSEWAEKLWDYQFSFDRDEFGDDTGLILEGLNFTCSKERYTGNQFEGDSRISDVDTGYKDWPDKKRRDFQKAWFKIYYNGQAIGAAYKAFIVNWCNCHNKDYESDG